MGMDRLRELLVYSPATGKMHWRVNRPGGVKSGDEAGVVGRDGYRRIKVNGTQRYAHRLAFRLMGFPTPDCVDHINRARDDNRWCNLRPADATLNAENRTPSPTSRSKTGHTNVNFLPYEGKYRVRFRRNGVVTYVGLYPTVEEAVAARDFALSSTIVSVPA